MPPIRPRLPLPRVIEMNIGFFGLQFSFGLQQANMAPIYGILGAREAEIPVLWLAGPMTGLIVQPLVGALSDRTVSRFGRRTPYMLVGAVLCSLGLLAMPYSSALWMAAGLLWLLDSGNNLTMEPYRAYVADRLDAEQRPLGFMLQSAFTGLAQSLSYLAPSLLAMLVDRRLTDANGIPAIVRIAFAIGAVLSVSTILWSLWRVPEQPLGHAQRTPDVAPLRLRQTLADVSSALAQMPPPVKRLALAMLFQWYAMFAYWQYIAFALARSLYGTSDAASAAFHDATLTAQQLGALYNLVAFLGAIALVPALRKLGTGPVHCACLAFSGLCMLAIPGTGSVPLLMVLMIGIGLGWASMMGSNYELLARSIPPQQNGIYMGIFNMFIVIPMLVEIATMPLLYGSVLRQDPRNVLVLAGLLMVLAALATRPADTGERRKPSVV